MVSIGPLTCGSSGVKLYGDGSRLIRRLNRPFTGLSTRLEDVTTGGNAQLLDQIVLIGTHCPFPGRNLPIEGGIASRFILVS
jgi:hypothetical protein